MIDILGHIAYLFVMTGTFLLHPKFDRVTLGWTLRGVGDAGWVGLGISMGMTSIWIWGSVFVAIDLAGYTSAKLQGEQK